MKFNRPKNYGLRLREQRGSLSHRQNIGRLSIKWRQLDNTENINEPGPNLRLHKTAWQMRLVRRAVAAALRASAIREIR